MHVRLSYRMSIQFIVGNRVKLGGVLSPLLISAYDHKLIKILIQMNVNCEIHNKII